MIESYWYFTSESAVSQAKTKNFRIKTEPVTAGAEERNSNCLAFVRITLRHRNWNLVPIISKNRKTHLLFLQFKQKTKLDQPK